MVEIFTPDKLFAGEFDRVVVGRTLLSGENRKRGTLLGKITIGGKLKLCNSATDPADGSQVPYAILAEDCDASGADKPCLVYLSGEFNEDAITYGGTDTADTHREALRNLGIYLRETVPA